MLILTWEDQLLEKETKRLEDELEKIQFTNELREKELAQVKLECERLTREVRKLNGGKESGGEDGSEISLPSLALDPMHTATGKFLDSVFRDVCCSSLLPFFSFSHDA